MSIDEARERARTMVKRIHAGQPAVEAAAETFGAVVETWRKRHVEKNGLRSADEINRLLDRHVLPGWGDRAMTAIRKSDIAALLDHVEDDHGARQADYVLNVVRNIMNWHASRSDDFNPPIVRGMRRQSRHAQRRSRVLDDDELRAIWRVAENAGAFGAVVRILLLTAQRRERVLSMKHAEIDATGTWTIPKEPREKDNAGVLALPDSAIAVLRAQPRFAGNPFIFAGRTKGPISGMSKFKARLDAASGVSEWTLHDLRRTARSLMSRAGVPAEHAERVMGHVIGGVEGVYDRHSYANEKAAALAKLAALMDDIVSPRDKVVAIRGGKRR